MSSVENGNRCLISSRDITLRSTRMAIDFDSRPGVSTGIESSRGSLTLEWEIISHTPPVKWLKVPDPEFDFLDFEEADRLVKGGVGEWTTMIVLGLGTGMRQGELLALRWEDVDLVVGRLMVRQAVARGIIGTPKSGKPREIPLNAKVMRALKAHRHLRGELVFCDSDGKMLKKGCCRWPIWSACRRAGLRRISWHVLRHTSLHTS